MSTAGSAPSSRVPSSQATSWRAREFAFGPADYRVIAKLAYDGAGIVLPETKAQLVYGRLAPRVRALGLASIADYVTLIESDPAERGVAIDALTTNHTSFFRERHHFDHFATHMWPELSQRLASGGRVRLWSAACSTGEEAYTWLMSLFGDDRNAALRVLGSDFRMLATDISSRALAVASAGQYSKATLAAVPPKLRLVWLSGSGATQTVDPLLREAITFRSLNLLAKWPVRNCFDAIFCRNVMIYFDDATKARLQACLADQLHPGAMLYLGHSERLIGGVERQFESVGGTAYQKLAA